MLWRLAPPMYARNGGQQLADKMGEYQSMTLEQEEHLAWMRYQRAFGGRNMQADVEVEQLFGRDSLLSGSYDGRGHDAASISTPNTLMHEQRTIHDVEDRRALVSASEDHEMDGE